MKEIEIKKKTRGDWRETIAWNVSRLLVPQPRRRPTFQARETSANSEKHISTKKPHETTAVHGIWNLGSVPRSSPPGEAISPDYFLHFY